MSARNGQRGAVWPNLLGPVKSNLQFLRGCLHSCALQTVHKKAHVLMLVSLEGHHTSAWRPHRDLRSWCCWAFHALCPPHLPRASTPQRPTPPQAPHVSPTQLGSPFRQPSWWSPQCYQVSSGRCLEKASAGAAGIFSWACCSWGTW